MQKILLIGQDNLLAHRSDLEVDFIPTGKAYTPDAPRYRSSSALVQIPRVLHSFFSGKYDAAVIPAIDTSGHYGDTILQRCLRAIFHSILNTRSLSSCAQNLIAARTKVLILDRYDSTTIQSKQALFTGAESYWKLNLRKDQPLDNKFKIQPLPCWVYSLDSFASRSPLPWAERDIDLFCSFSVNSEAKKNALEWARRLPRNGSKIFIADSMLSPFDFHEHMARSKIILSPEGIGYHCFRHYQAMMHGAVPLVDKPGNIMTDLEHEKNSLLYEKREESFRSLLNSALHDDKNLEVLAYNCRDFWMQHHSPMSVGDKLVTYLRKLMQENAIVKDS